LGPQRHPAATRPLNSASGKIPAPRGPIRIDWKVEDDFKLVLTIPEGMTAKVEVPARASSRGVFLRGEPVIAKRIGTRWVLKDDISGSVVIEVR
jgi:alpha-L-rhamnosidase